MTGLANRVHAHNMRGDDHCPGWCAVCGRPHPERHHVVARALGGAAGPVVQLCGFGSNLLDADGRMLCHGAAEHHYLHFWWCDGTDPDLAPAVSGRGSRFWAYLLADEPCDDLAALAMPGWRPLP